jgi:predicted ATPase
MAYGTLLQGWALAEQGQSEEGIVQMRQSWAATQATGAGLFRPYFLARLAEAYGIEGRTEEGLNTVVEALAVIDETGERLYEAELYRLKGELTLQLETRDWRLETSSAPSQASSLQPLASPAVVREAEECFLKALDISRKQQAKSLELRAAMSLVRLRQRQIQDHATRNTQHATSSAQHATRTTQHVPRARLDEAHKMLSEIYNWFTEGFDTKDLQEAKALLEGVSRTLD